MSLFKTLKYSALFYFLNKHRHRVFRIAAVSLMLLALLWLYPDLLDYLRRSHPDLLGLAVLFKFVLVFTVLGWILWQLRPRSAEEGVQRAADLGRRDEPPPPSRPEPKPLPPDGGEQKPAPRGLDLLANVDEKETLRSRYDSVLEKKKR